MLLLQALLISITVGAASALNARIKSPNHQIVPPGTKIAILEQTRGGYASNQRAAHAISLTPALVALLALSSPADAIEGPLSILAGRSASMLHPITNLALFGMIFLFWATIIVISQELQFTRHISGFSGEDYVRSGRKLKC